MPRRAAQADLLLLQVNKRDDYYRRLAMFWFEHKHLRPRERHDAVVLLGRTVYRVVRGKRHAGNGPGHRS